MSDDRRMGRRRVILQAIKQLRRILDISFEQQGPDYKHENKYISLLHQSTLLITEQFSSGHLSDV
jgi:hypothetical protein